MKNHKFNPGDAVRLKDSYYELYGVLFLRREFTIKECLRPGAYRLWGCSTPIDEDGIELAGGPW